MSEEDWYEEASNRASLVGVPSTARGFRISTAKKRYPLNHRTKYTAMFVGGASTERDIELDTSVPQSARDQYVSSMELCSALPGASGSAAKEVELSIDVALLIPQTPADRTPEQEVPDRTPPNRTDRHSAGSACTGSGEQVTEPGISVQLRGDPSLAAESLLPAVPRTGFCGFSRS